MIINLGYLSICLCCLPGLLFSQRPVPKGVIPQKVTKSKTAKFSEEGLQGKWQEISRYSIEERKIHNFSDTLMISIQQSTVEIRESGSSAMTMKGSLQLDPPDVLTLAGESFTIVDLTKEKLVLNDGNFTHYLEPRESFQYETYGKGHVNKDAFENPISVGASVLKGKWFVYRRQASPGAGNDLPLIKWIEIVNIEGPAIARGNIQFYQSDITEQLPCTVTTEGGRMHIQAGKYSWDFYIYKATDEELVFGNKDKVLYYCKH